MIGVGDFQSNETIERNLLEVARSGRVSYGKFSREAEARWAELAGCRHAIAVSSGTAALHVALLALGEARGWVKGRSEIILPAVTFVATLNAVLHAGYVPRLVDVDLWDGLISVPDIREFINENTVAIIPVHLFGQAAPLRMIRNIADQHGLAIIEDSCEAVLARDGDKVVGSVGEFACFSTYVAHHISCGSGGFLTTNSKELNDIARSIVNHGRDVGYFDPDRRARGASEVQFLFHRTGLNYRSSELNSAVVCGLLDNVHQSINRRRELAALYQSLLSPIVGSHIQITHERPGMYHSWMMMPILASFCSDRAGKIKFMEWLWGNGIDSRETLPLTNQPYVSALGICEEDFPNARRWNQIGMYLPNHNYLSDGDVTHICNSVKNYISQNSEASQRASTFSP